VIQPRVFDSWHSDIWTLLCNTLHTLPKKF